MADLETALDRVIESRLRSVHTAMPGKVQSYDAQRRTAEIIPQIVPTIPGTDPEDDEDLDDPMPVLMNVPVLFPRAGGVILTLPVQAGDTVLVVVCEREIGRWRATGRRDRAQTQGLHTLNGAVAIPGLYPSNAAAPTFTVAMTPTAMEVGGNTDAAALALRVSQLEADFIAHFHNDPVSGATSGALVGAPPGPPTPRDYASQVLKLGG